MLVTEEIRPIREKGALASGQIHCRWESIKENRVGGSTRYISTWPTYEISKARQWYQPKTPPSLWTLCISLRVDGSSQSCHLQQQGTEEWLKCPIITAKINPTFQFVDFIHIPLYIICYNPMSISFYRDLCNQWFQYQNFRLLYSIKVPTWLYPYPHRHELDCTDQGK